MKPEKIVAGSKTFWGSDAYAQAVLEGMVDPRNVSREAFMRLCDHTIHDADDRTYYGDIGQAVREASDVVRGTERGRMAVLRWFGKSK